MATESYNKPQSKLRKFFRIPCRRNQSQEPKDMNTVSKLIMFPSYLEMRFPTQAELSTRTGASPTPSRPSSYIDSSNQASSPPAKSRHISFTPIGPSWREKFRYHKGIGGSLIARTRKEKFTMRHIRLKRKELFEINETPILDTYEQCESQVKKFLARMDDAKFDIVLITVEKGEVSFHHAEDIIYKVKMMFLEQHVKVDVEMREMKYIKTDHLLDI